MLRRKFKIICSSICEKGDIRENNQDCVLVKYDQTAGRTAGIFMVADGCGGLAHGDEISRMVADCFESLWDERIVDFRENPERILTDVPEQICRINEKVLDYGIQINERVGSTMSLLILIGRRYYIFHAGDSRIYLYRKKRAFRLTEDQTLLADRLRNGEITIEEALNYKGKNPLTMCIGYFDPVRIFTASGTARRGDIFLLCSDGFYNGIGDTFFGKVFPEEVTEESSAYLRQMIPDGKANDNVSVVIFQLE